MQTFIVVDGIAYDIETERDRAHQALLDNCEVETRVYEGDPDGEHRATVMVLRDSGMLHQVSS